MMYLNCKVNKRRSSVIQDKKKAKDLEREVIKSNKRIVIQSLEEK